MNIAAARGDVHVLRAAVSAASNLLDFGQTQRLIVDGYELATRRLNDRKGQSYRDRAPICS